MTLRRMRAIAVEGITDGTGNGNYSPHAKLTRGELLVKIGAVGGNTGGRA